MAGSSHEVYVTFSGESASPVKHVRAYDASGAKKGRVTPDYDELRGMTLDTTGRLYLAVANKSVSQVLLFSATVNGDGTRDLVATVVTPATSPGISHPYGLTFDGPGQLFVSSQDTNCVTGFTIGTQSPPQAQPLAVATYLSQNFPKNGANGAFYAGEYVASVVPIVVQGDTPPAVPADQGGLSEQGLAAALPVPGSPAAAAQAANTKKHSVRGVHATPVALYVVDEAANRVGIYDLSTGAFQGAIATTGGTGKQDALDDPVGLAYDPAKGHLFIGSARNACIFAYHEGSKTLHLVAHDDTQLAKVSGLAWTPAGTLLAGSRQQNAIVSVDVSSGAISSFVDGLKDAPECLLVVA